MCQKKRTIQELGSGAAAKARRNITKLVKLVVKLLRLEHMIYYELPSDYVKPLVLCHWVS